MVRWSLYFFFFFFTLVRLATRRICFFRWFSFFLERKKVRKEYKDNFDDWWKKKIKNELNSGVFCNKIDFWDIFFSIKKVKVTSTLVILEQLILELMWIFYFIGILTWKIFFQRHWIIIIFPSLLILFFFYGVWSE